MEQQAGTDDGMDRLAKAIFRIEASQAELKTYLLEFRAEVLKRFEQMESREAIVMDTIRSIDVRLPGLTRAIVDLQVRLDRLERPAA